MNFKQYIIIRFSRLLSALFFIFFTFLSLPSTRCMAADDENDTQIMARKLFKQGLKFYDSRKYAEALDKFQQAYAYKSSY
ncbi:MAG: hypothetical protein JXR91_03485, partial [Deltaproteobacteria bacterium]|nr:hypothetical protein [Deltaproteobacteria bacterium]